MSLQELGCAPVLVTDETTICMRRFAMEPGDRFGRHQHREHQLCWSPCGLLQAEVHDSVWLLAPSHALWIPGDLPHDVSATQPALLHSLYFLPERCPVAWSEPTVVAVGPLLRALMCHLVDVGLRNDARRRAESVVFDLLAPVDGRAPALGLPTDDRALTVARALINDPSDSRTLAEWGRAVGASRRTLARRFVAETGLTFSAWRTQVRLRAALAHLDAGAPTTLVAHRVGYQSTSAFIAAFRRTVGRTPGEYAKW